MSRAPHACTVILLSALVLHPLPARTETQAKAGRSLVRVLATRQEFDAHIPWQKERPVEVQGYGVAVDTNLILTTESTIRNHNLILLLQPRHAERIPATVVASDLQANLALLKVNADMLPEPLVPLALATNAPFETELSIIQFDDSRQVQAGGATFLRASIEVLPSAPYPSLVFDVLTDQNINGDGAPVLMGEDLAGLVMSYAASTRTATVLPASVLQHFLADVGSPPYDGFASAGFIWKELVDPAKRQWLGVNQRDGGVLVVATVPGSGAAETLQPNDVVLSWDSEPIDNLGFYQDPIFGRMMFPYLIRERRVPGDTVPVTIMRNHTVQLVEVELQHATEENMLIPENTAGNRAEYLLEGGLLLRELTGRYMRAHGSAWQRHLDSSLVHLYLTKRTHPDAPGERVVVLTHVLPHPANVGYQHLRNVPVTHANGQPVSNMSDIFRIKAEDRFIHRLTLRTWGVDVVLDKDTIEEANRALARTYQISELYRQHDTGDSDL